MYDGVVVLVALLIFCRSNRADPAKPDLTLFSTFNDSFTCVAGSNLRDSAVFFQSNMDFRKTESAYLLQNGTLAQDNYYCLFGADENCRREWNISGASYVNYEKYETTPILDTRWEGFKILKSKNKTEMSKLKNNRIILSMYLEEDAHIHLSLRDTNNTYYAVSFTNELLKIEYCKKDLHCDELKVGNVSIKGWTHFTIKLDERYITIEEYASGNFYYRVPHKNEQLQNVFLFNNKKNTWWKIHRGYFLFLNLNETFTYIGEAGTAKEDGQYCVSFYVTLCSNCTMDININNQKKHETIRGENLMAPGTKLQKWKNVKMTVNIKEGSKAKLYMRGHHRNNENKFWGIDYIRQCDPKETRIIKVTFANKNKPSHIYCKSLFHPDWQAGYDITATRINKTSETQFCGNISMFGEECNIPCSSIFGEEYCGRSRICKSTLVNNSSSVCTCTAGYHGQQCENECSNGMYGWNCVKNCNHCKNNSCWNTNGLCKAGCVHGYGNAPKCDARTFPVLLNPVQITNTDLYSITFKIQNKTVDGSAPADIAKIQYRESDVPDWQTHGERKFSELIEYSLTNLKKGVSYKIRLVLKSNNNDYEGNDIPFATATTKCEDSYSYSTLVRNFTFTPETNHVIVKWEAVCNDTFQLKLECKNEWCVPKDVSTSSISYLEETVVSELCPFTNYSVEIISNSQKYQQSKSLPAGTFQTKPDAPDHVQEFEVYSKDENYLALRWKPPYPPKGILENYQLATMPCNKTYSTPTFVKIDYTLCRIWPQYLCYTAKNITNKCVNIQMRAKNINVPKLGFTNEIRNISAEQSESDPPENVAYKWDSNDLILTWSHPNKSNGDITKFFIEFYLRSTELKEIKEKFKKFEYQVNETNYSYSYKVPEDKIIFASEIDVHIYGKNKYEGKRQTIRLTTPAPKPELQGNISLKRNSGETFLDIPSILPGSLTKYSSAKISCCNIRNKHGFSETNLNSNEGKDVCTEINLKSDDFPIQITLDSRQCLEKYKIILTIQNKYRETQAINAYEVATTEEIVEYQSSYSGYYAFLLLLLLPLIAYLIYRYRKQIYQAIPVEQMQDSVNNHSISMVESKNVPIQTYPKSLQLSKEEETKLLSENVSGDMSSKRVYLKDFSNYVKLAIERGLLKSQHEQFQKGPVKPWTYGMVQENRFKNRYNNVTAYDENRVVLSKMHGDEFSDFINASYIDGYNQSKAYIATQGPKPSTINDFWRMIWQEKVKYIVMLANLVEGGKRKCEKYWPNINTSQTFIDTEVTFEKSEIFADYEYRTFHLKKCNEEQKVYHLHFTSWPDHGVPLYPQSLVSFLKKMLTISVKESPIVVHCSAGVGRTGTIILCDICLRMAASEGAVDVVKYFSKIRQQRVNMVDNVDQYTLVHLVLLECLLSPVTSIPCNDQFENMVSKLIQEHGIEEQMKFLEDTLWRDTVVEDHFRVHEFPENRKKNRFPELLPERNRVFLKRYPVTNEHSDYINAVRVDGFRNKDQFIVTQRPLPNTIGDFWRMIHEHDVKVIVSLNDIPPDDMGSIWPITEDKILQPVPYLNLKYKSIKVYEFYDIYTIQIEHLETEITSFDVYIFQCKFWESNEIVPNSIETLLEVLDDAQNRSRHGNPMVVSCFDGASSCGIFVGLSFIIEKIKLEQNCDVCLAVRIIRRNRRQFIKNQMQFEFLYNAAVAYLRTFEIYSNFKPTLQKIQ